MNIKDRILLGREERAKIINEYLKEFKTVVSVKANFPGDNKNSYISYLLINAFSFLISDSRFIRYHLYQNYDGPFVICLSNDLDTLKIKKLMIEIEENHELGRYIDIDVYSIKGIMSRKTKRKCIVCEEDAFKCIINRKHSIEEVSSVIKNAVHNYYTKFLKDALKKSFLGELRLEPKFGLVTPTSSGSHSDMNYDLMVKAIDIIIPYFIDMFFESCIGIDETSIVSNINLIGKMAETDMFRVTKGINAYKGAIFNLGLAISGIGYKISRFYKRSIFEITKRFSEILFVDYKYDSNSFGDIAYREYGLRGIRGEALSGFLNVQKALKILKGYSEESLLETLVYLIVSIDDTTFLKRAKSLDFYFKVKEMFSNLNLRDFNQVHNLNDFCIKKGLSFGGSADLLIMSIFISRMNKYCLNLI
ncbi:MAG: triphosphoribosyl-dephospho-CoA synthase [Candidatus Izemoplasmatales bacterium]|nr:triphosphoribosyl-dephospho-CoA synthase [Candidatus Izemoplasmatales bacterium]